MQKQKHEKVMPMSRSSIELKLPDIVHWDTDVFFIQIYLTCNEIVAENLALFWKHKS